jgi:hypothetical protein
MALPILIPIGLALVAGLYFLGGSSKPASGGELPAGGGVTPGGGAPPAGGGAPPGDGLPLWLTAPLNPPADIPPIPLYNNPQGYQARTAAPSVPAIEAAGQVLGPILADQLAMSDATAAAAYLTALANYCQGKGLAGAAAALQARAGEVNRGTASLPAWFGPMTFEKGLPLAVRSRLLYLATIGRWSVVGEVLPALGKVFPQFAAWLSAAMVAAAAAPPGRVDGGAPQPYTGSTPPPGWPAGFPWPGFWPAGMAFPAGAIPGGGGVIPGGGGVIPGGNPWGDKPPPGWPAGMAWPPVIPGGGAPPGGGGAYPPPPGLKLPPRAKWDAKEGVIRYTLKEGDWGIDPIMARFGKKSGGPWLKMVYAYNPGKKFGPKKQGGNLNAGDTIRLHESAGLDTQAPPAADEYMANADAKRALKAAMAQEAAAAKKPAPGQAPGKPGKAPPGAPAKPGKAPPPAEPAAPLPSALATVRDVQEALTALGYQPGAVDGKNGPKTSAALAAFQKASELPPTGKFDPQTKAAMAAALAAKKLPRPAPPANHGPAWGPDMRD